MAVVHFVIGVLHTGIDHHGINRGGQGCRLVANGLCLNGVARGRKRRAVQVVVDIGINDFSLPSGDSGSNHSAFNILRTCGHGNICTLSATNDVRGV